jgi:hypothetical protein
MAGRIGPLGNNYSVSFDGVNDFVEAGTTSSFNYYHGATNPSAFAFTIGLWFKTPALTSFQNLLGNINTSTSVGIRMGLNSRACFFQIFTGSVLVVQHQTAVNSLPNTNGWIHVLWAYNQALASANSTIYINNVSAGTVNKTANAPSTANATGNMNFARTNLNTNLFTGNEYNVFFAQGVITSGERAALIANPKTNPLLIIKSTTVTNAYRFPSGVSNFPTWVDTAGGVNGTMTNQTSANIKLDTP